MEELVNSAISQLEAFESSVLAPFFQNPNTINGIMIAIGAIGLFYNVPNNVKKLFDSVTFRLIWMLLIVLAIIYDPVIGLLTALCYIMFMKPSKESFTNTQHAQCPPKGDDFPVQEPQSFAQEQLEILESKEETTHLERLIEGSKEVMNDSIKQ